MVGRGIQNHLHPNFPPTLKHAQKKLRKRRFPEFSTRWPWTVGWTHRPTYLASLKELRVACLQLKTFHFLSKGNKLLPNLCGAIKLLATFQILAIMQPILPTFFSGFIFYTHVKGHTQSQTISLEKCLSCCFFFFFHLYCRPKHHTPCGWEVLFQSCNPFLTAYHLLLLIAIWYSK